MAERRKIIRVPGGAAKQIAENLGCALTTVYSALNNTTHSEQAKTIRRLALSDYGGIEDRKVFF